MASILQHAEVLRTPEISGAITLRSLTAPGDLEPLVIAEGLGMNCRYRPGETLRMLARVLNSPEGRVVGLFPKDLKEPIHDTDPPACPERARPGAVGLEQPPPHLKPL